MGKDYKIRFDGRPQAVFYSGETVSGTLTFFLKKSKKLQDITFRVKGETRVSWSESHQNVSTKKNQTIWFHGYDLHFRSESSLLYGNYPRQDGCPVLPEGTHNLPFNFTLPPNIPSSYEGSFGQTRYSIKIYVYKPKKEDHAKTFFTVVTTHDLNCNLNNLVPVIQNLKKDCTFLFTNQGTITATVSVPITGFVPGQEIPINLYLKNSSKATVSDIKFSLERSTRYVCTNPHSSQREDRRKIVEFLSKGVEKGKDSNVLVKMIVPATPPTTTYGYLITTVYVIKVKITISGMHTNLKTFIPINLGTIPMQTHTSQHTSGHYTGPNCGSNTFMGFVVPSVTMGQPGSHLPVSPYMPPGGPHMSSNPHMSPGSHMLSGPNMPPGPYTPNAPHMEPEQPGLRMASAPNFQDIENAAPIQHIPPPSYEQSQISYSMMPDQERVTANSESFTPMYPIYNYTNDKNQKESHK